ncbi:MAG: hypothetical protein ISR65_01535 [Bacteriovoracaceae bacterium]|nr:hypothetical protein [Bacteriovoracaceae bacterium]
MTTAKATWLKGITEKLMSLEGQKIIKVIGCKEPLDWKEVDSDEVPVYDHPSLSFQQIGWIVFEVQNKGLFRLTTSQNDSIFGLFLESIEDEPEIELDEKIDLSNKLCGLVNKVKVNVIGEDIGEIHMTIGDKDILFVAGEVELGEDEIIIRSMDESILFFENPNDYKKLDFNKSIPFKF